MERLYKGIHKFKSSYFKKKEEFFQRLSEGQSPEVLFITCADSRVDPNLVTQSRPGELFIMRNVGNIIPPYDAIKDKNSVAAGLEFAVLRLRVKDIIVCGHSGCGAMQALHKAETELNDMPHLKEWISIANPSKELVDKLYADEPMERRMRLTEFENVLLQLKNIETYPFVTQALQAGVLSLHGWYYDIGTGKVYSYNPATDTFEDIA